MDAILTALLIPFLGTALGSALIGTAAGQIEKAE